MIDIPEHEKVKIGQMIEFLRKRKWKENKTWTVERFIESVCSKATYAKLRKFPLKESETYDKLLAKLNLSYLYDDTRRNDFLRAEKQCALAFEKENDRTPKRLRALIESYAASDTIFECLTCLALTDSTLSISDLLQIHAWVRPAMKEIVMERILDALEQAPLSALTPAIQDALVFHTNRNQIQYLFLLIRNERFYEAASLCEELRKKDLTPRETARVRIAKLFLMHHIQPQSFEEEASRLRAEPFFPLLARDWIHICAIHTYFQRDFEKAKPLLMEEVVYEKTFFPAVLFLAHMHGSENGFDKQVFYRFPIDRFPVEYQHLYTYFDMKFNHASFDILENYLWTICRKEIKSFYPSSIMARLIRDELRWISEQTNDRTRLYAFRQQFG
ncbi:hypothetical protein [uncultured Dubosiella sp.]|uniref:hypothetical protein n=1 Tax=uncultured Dubosiella sp. TaxID=1937011 RepID=UPI00272FA5C4|nr:hypothetical protein [uncultured Dubosiella sp.]